LNKKDFNDYAELFFYSFNIKENEIERQNLRAMFENSYMYGSRFDGRLVTSIINVPFTTDFFGENFKVASLANVISAPEYDKSDGIKVLVNQAIRDMYQNMTVLSYLYPFSYDYYRRFGYEQAFELLKMELPFEKLAKFNKPNHGYVKRFKFSAAQESIRPIFERHNRAGGIKETDWWWAILKLRYPDYMTAVTFDDTDEITGYLIYSFEENTFVIHDFVYETPDSFLAMMNFVNKHKSMYKNLVINSSDTRINVSQFVTNPLGVKTTIEPFMMVRIINLKKFMTDYPINLSNMNKIKIKVNDQLEWNNHTWELTIDSGKVEFHESQEERADLELDIQTLTMAMFGYQSLETSYLVGKIKGDITKIRTVDKMFIHEKARLNGKF